MAFYTDWYDYSNLNDFLKLPKQINADAKTEDQRRPQKSEMYLLLNGLEEIYSQNSKFGFNIQAGKTISEILIELGKAAQTKESYRKALTEKSNWIKYCAFFSLVFYENQANMLFLRNLCKEFNQDVNLTDIITEQHNVFLQRNMKESKTAVLIKQLKANIK